VRERGERERERAKKSFSLFLRSGKGSDQKSEIFGELHLIKFPSFHGERERFFFQK